MPFDPDNLLMVGISSSALFDAREEDRIFRELGLDEFIRYQIANENAPFPRGTGFPLVQALLRLNQLSKKRLVEVTVISHNDPAAGLRAMNSLEHYKLDISRAAFVGATAIGRYLQPYRVKLLLSRNETDVRDAVAMGVAAGLIYDPPGKPCSADDELRIAFDGDAVIFSDESERIYKETNSLDAFYAHEQANAQKPMADGPFAAFLRWIAQVQSTVKLPNGRTSIRTALVTARNGPAMKRVILTLRAWGVRIDEEFFLGGMAKGEILAAFNPHIFFDDQDIHAAPASRLVATARVPYGPTADLIPVEILQPLTTETPENKILVETAAQTKKGYEDRCREIFRRYTPLHNGVIDPRFRKFIRETRDRSNADRRAILQDLLRYDLSSLTTHDPQLNRENDDSLSQKLEKIIKSLGPKKQSELDLN